MARSIIKSSEKAMIILLSLLFCIFMASPALAGDGTGGGRGNPVTLVSSNPADGQQDVSLSTSIKLGFSKNVVNMRVKDNNQKCFSMSTVDGANVPIKVIMADDQINPEKRRDIILSPLKELQPGITYSVKISPELEAKSGDTLEKEVTLTFVTKDIEGKLLDDVNDKQNKDADVTSTVDNQNNAETEPSQEDQVLSQPASEPEVNLDSATETSTNDKDSTSNNDSSANEKEVKKAQEAKEAESKVKEENQTIQETKEIKETNNTTKVSKVSADSKEAVGDSSQIKDKEKAKNSNFKIIVDIGLVFIAALVFYFYKRKKM